MNLFIFLFQILFKYQICFHQMKHWKTPSRQHQQYHSMTTTISFLTWIQNLMELLEMISFSHQIASTRESTSLVLRRDFSVYLLEILYSLNIAKHSLVLNMVEPCLTIIYLCGINIHIYNLSKLARKFHFLTAPLFHHHLSTTDTILSIKHFDGEQAIFYFHNFT